MEGIENPELISKENYDIGKWDGVTCNKQGEVVGIKWSLKGLRGTLRLDWLPLSIKILDISRNQFTRRLGFDKLPESLIYLEAGSYFYFAQDNW